MFVVLVLHTGCLKYVCVCVCACVRACVRVCVCLYWRFNLWAFWLGDVLLEVGAVNWFKPSSKIFYWPFQGGTSFVDHLCFYSVLCLLCLCVRLFICALWSPAGKGLNSWLSFVVWVCHFPIGILGQVWYLIVSIPDLCTLTYFAALVWFRNISKFC